MPLELLPRHAWTGQRTADCELWTHVVGWELRLTSGATLLQSAVCRAQEDVLGTHEAWKAAMIDKGWN